MEENNRSIKNNIGGKKIATDKNWIKLDPQIKMSDLILLYPELIEPLTYDYGLHCVNCMIAEFDTLQEGAVIHGIDGEDLADMIKDLEEMINNPEEQDN